MRKLTSLLLKTNPSENAPLKAWLSVIAPIARLLLSLLSSSFRAYDTQKYVPKIR